MCTRVLRGAASDTCKPLFVCQEVYRLRFGALPRAPDAVVWPGEHAHVERIIAAAVAHGVLLIPYGGGTRCA